MFFIRHRQCSVYSLKLSDSCLSWTQEGPYGYISSSTPAQRDIFGWTKNLETHASDELRLMR